jgi:6-phosphofructokinase 1
MEQHGIPVVGVPKTIDNDLSATDFTFGFWSAVEVATEALDRLHTTAEAHDRVMLLEVMGRDAGWIALYAGVAGGADCIALPEIPYNVDRFLDKIRARRQRGRHFTLVVVAEGAFPGSGPGPDHSLPKWQRSAGNHLAELIRQRTHHEVRVTVLGHLQRGGSPVPFDRVLATRFGVHAVQLIEAGQWGEMVCLERDDVTSVPLAEAARDPRLINLDHPLLGAASAVGIELGSALAETEESADSSH